MGEYLKWSGDVDFVRSQWERVERAMDHLHSTIRNDYGFIENYNVGHGWVEFGPLAGSDVEVYPGRLLGGSIASDGLHGQNTG